MPVDSTQEDSTGQWSLHYSPLLLSSWRWSIIQHRKLNMWSVEKCREATLNEKLMHLFKRQFYVTLVELETTSVWLTNLN